MHTSISNTYMDCSVWLSVGWVMLKIHIYGYVQIPDYKSTVLFKLSASVLSQT